MELAFVLAFVLLGTAAILYAGLREPLRKPDAGAGSEAAMSPDHDGSSSVN